MCRRYTEPGTKINTKIIFKYQISQFNAATFDYTALYQHVQISVDCWSVEWHTTGWIYQWSRHKMMNAGVYHGWISYWLRVAEFTQAHSCAFVISECDEQLNGPGKVNDGKRDANTGFDRYGMNWLIYYTYKKSTKRYFMSCGVRPIKHTLY